MIQSLVSKKAQSDTWSIFFRLGVVLQIKIKSTKCRTWPFFSTSSRIRRVVMFDKRVFDEKSCTDWRDVKVRMLTSLQYLLSAACHACASCNLCVILKPPLRLYCKTRSSVKFESNKVICIVYCIVILILLAA